MVPYKIFNLWQNLSIANSGGQQEILTLFILYYGTFLDTFAPKIWILMMNPMQSLQYYERLTDVEFERKYYDEVKGFKFLS